jgi:hypothetical protein
MSAAQLVPMLAPDGTPGYVPSERVQDAINAGGKVGVGILAPDGTRGVIPQARVQDALRAGGQLIGAPIARPNPNMQAASPAARFGEAAVSAGSDALLHAGPQMATAQNPQDLVPSVQKDWQSIKAIPNAVINPVKRMFGGDVAGGAGELAGQAPAGVLQGTLYGPAIQRAGGAAVDATTAAGRAAVPVAGKVAGFLSDVVGSDITGVFSPRLAHVQQVLGRLSDALKARAAQTGEGQPSVKPPTPLPSPAELTAVQTDVASALRNQGYTAQAAEHWARQSQASDFDTAFREATGAAKPLVTQEFQRPASEPSPNRADLWEDKAIEDQMRADLEQHGQSAMREAGQEFRAGSSVNIPKWQMAAEYKAQEILTEAHQKIQEVLTAAEKQATTPKRYTRTQTVTPKATAPEDLVPILEESIAKARAAKALAGEK